MNLETVYLFSIKTIKHFVAGKQMGTKNVQCCFFQQTSDVTRDALRMKLPKRFLTLKNIMITKEL